LQIKTHLSLDRNSFSREDPVACAPETVTVSGAAVTIFKYAILVVLFSIGIIWVATAPAKAQAALSPGCTCPAGFFGSTGNICVNLRNPAIDVPATCSGGTSGNAAYAQAVGHVAASQQQISFNGIQSIIQVRRDQLQGLLPVPRGATPLGYMPSSLTRFDGTMSALSYTEKSDQSGPFANFEAQAPTPVTGPAWAAWGQSFGDWEHNGALTTADIAHTTDTYGVQFGTDGTWLGLTPGGGAMVAGLVGSYMDSNVNFNGTPTSLRLQGGGFGLYQTFLQGGFSEDVTAKFDFLQLNENLGPGTPVNLVGLTNAGVSGNAQYLIKLDNGMFVEPTGGFSFTRTIFGSGAAALGLQDATTVRLQGGARFGSTWEMNGATVEASLKALIYSDVVAQGTSIVANTLGAGILPTDQDLVRGELDPEVSICLPENYTVTLSGNARFGQDLAGGSVKLALRKQF
jgi:hypothetical protein